MKQKFYLLFILFSSHLINAQSPNASDTRILSKDEIDKKLDEIAKVSKTFTDSKQESILLKLMSESKKAEYDWGILRSGNSLTSVYLGQGKYQKTINLINELKKISKNKKDVFGYISSIHRRNALVLGYLGLNDASLKDFKEAIRYAKQIQNNDRRKHQLALSYENINIYYENKEKEPGISDTILSNYLKSLEITKTISDSKIEVPIDDKYGMIAYISMSLGFFYLEHSGIKGNLELAERYLLDAKKIYENKKYNTDPEQKAETFNELSKLYIKKNEYQKTIEYASEALRFEKQHSFPTTRKESYEYLLQAYLEIGDNKKAKFYRDKYTALNDSLNYEERKAANATMKKMVSEVDNVHKENSKKQLVIIGILALIVTITAFFIWRRNNKKLRKNYEQIIGKLQQEPTQNKTPINNINRNTISSETEERILNQLETFENSEGFLRNDLNISMLSIELNTNAKYLSEIIKNKKSHSFSSYSNSLKINYIVHKLYNEPKYRNYKISHLAEICGYSSPQVFFVAFKKINGVTPSYFIQSLNEDKI